MRIRSGWVFSFGLAAVSLSAAPARALDRVQPPELAVGNRASLAGSLANLSFGPSDVNRGGFSLATPFLAPKDRGEILAQVFPSYNPDNGISAWGMGFSNALTLTRFRLAGSLSYDFTKGDELTGPFGRLTRGTDGSWYPVGLEKVVRVVASGDDFIAYLPDGARWTFGGAARIVAANGTYAWHLREARDSVGHVTTLAWTANASGNLFLSRVEYGGRTTSQNRIDLEYEPVTRIESDGVARPKFVDYRSGSPIALDRRVKTVTISARNAKTSAFEERYHYALRYTEEAIGAAFYLAEIDTIYASGEAAPPVTYRFNLKGDDLARASRREVPELTTLLGTLGVTPDVLQPEHTTVTDADLDGNSDLEIGNDVRTLISQKGSGTVDDPLRFEVSSLPSVAVPACSSSEQVGCTFAACRPSADQGELVFPRLLSQLTPTDPTLHVVHFQYDSDADQTAISVCSREGVRSAKQWVDSRWEQSPFVRFVDLNSDHMPDLVRVGYGSYDVLPNASQAAGSEAAYAWSARVSGALFGANGEPILPDATWISDASGDGIPDIVAQYGDSIEVWYGLGNFQFTSTAQELRFFDTSGTPLSNFSHYRVIPSDLNKDGLQDYFVTNSPGDAGSSRFISYFTNVGGRFVQTPIPALDTLPWSSSAPVIATLDGTGNVSVTVTDDGKAYSVALDAPGTGLLASADDGKGTVTTFEYARGPASPGIRHRHALLASMRVQSSGYDSIGYDYTYAQPTIHSTGRFLVGFDSVTRREGDLSSAPLGTNMMSFLNGDNWGGLLLDGRETDARSPDVARISSRTYSDATFHGIPYKRLASSTSGWASADGIKRSVDVTTFDTYANDVCPAKTTLRTANHGTLVTQTTRANPANLANHLHCLESNVVHTGTHADRSLDFHDQQTITRNAAGLVTQIAKTGASGTLIEQQVAYDAELDPVRITMPGKGTMVISYDPKTKLASKTTVPDGTTTTVTSRDPVTDGILAVLTDRGGARWTEYARFDGQERLASRWNDLDGSSALAPREHYAYTYASTNQPATVSVRTLVDAATGVYRNTTELYTAAEEKIGTARLHDSGWVLDEFVARSRAYREEDRFLAMNQPASASLGSLDYATLLRGEGGAAPTELTTRTSNTLGMDVATTARLHTDVSKATSSTMLVNAAGQLVRTMLVNGANETTTLLDATDKLTLAYVDEAHTTFGYAYDALSRLRAVTLPDGARHTVSYDEYGRRSAVVRDGIARVNYGYAPLGSGTSDLIAKETFWSAPAAPATSVAQRSITTTYDVTGRRLTDTHADLVAGTSKVYAFYYDGATPAAPTAKTLTGLLTAVTGAGYTKTFSYRADGRTTRRELALDGFRTIVTEIAYREDGSLRDTTVTVKDPSGAVLERSAHHGDVDAFGRPSSERVNGSPLVTASYDTFGRVASAAFATGDLVTFAFDDLTRAPIGFDQTRAGHAWSGAASTRTKMNNRGFTGEEVLGIGPSAVKRTYSYSPQGFLTFATDGVRQ